MSVTKIKYIVLLGRLPGEGLWSCAESYKDLITQVKEAFGEDYNPIFKYKLPCNPKHASTPNGTCDIIINDEDDFQIWYNGCIPVPHHRDSLDDIHYPPNPLTSTLYVFRNNNNNNLLPTTSSSSSSMQKQTISKNKGENISSKLIISDTIKNRSSPEVLHLENDVVKMPLYSLLPPLLLLKLGIRVVLRHSNAFELILLSHRSISGAGEGHWGLLIHKAQLAWGVQRPAFRYLDLDRGVTAMNIFNSRDYMYWSTSIGRERTELIVVEHVYCEINKKRAEVELIAANILNENLYNKYISTIPTTTTTTTSTHTTAAQVIYSGREEKNENKEKEKEERNYTVTIAATVRGVNCGMFGPTFTSDGLIPPNKTTKDETVKCSLEHHRHLVATLKKSGIF